MTNVSAKSAQEIITDLLSEAVSDADREQIFMELVSKPITSDMLTGGVQALRNSMVPVDLDVTDTIDTCGTGGSGKKTVNTSTLTAFIVATAGGKVAKHGNRSASGNCGCFDVLEKLGVRIDLTPDMEKRIFEELGIVFLFAPSHHPSLRYVGPLRKALGRKTVFNLMGPLCNPAGVTAQLIGTGTQEHADIIAEALRNLGTENAYIATGHDGLDEVTVTDRTTIRHIHSGSINREECNPTDFAMPLSSPEAIEGGSVDENMEIFTEIAKGNGRPDVQNLAILNAAYALMLTSLVSDIGEAVALAKQTLLSGRVYDTFMQYKEYSLSL